MPNESDLSSVFSLIGEAGFSRLVAAFYRRVPQDSLLGPLYPPDDLAGAEARLRGFLVYRLGGPDAYVRERGHPRLRMRHATFAIDQKVRDRWVALMDEAMMEAELPATAVENIRPFLHETATFLINRGSGPSLIG